jgi:hypothetical protein
MESSEVHPGVRQLSRSRETRAAAMRAPSAVSAEK